MRIVYKYPSRSRPERFFKALDNIFSLSRTNDWKVIATLDVDDVTMYNEDVIERISNYGGKLEPRWGFSKNKVDAINKGLDNIGDFDVLICMSDDMIFTQLGFDEQIVSDALMYFNDTDFFLHYPDGAQKDTSTLNIAGKKYFDRTGKIYHEDFLSVYCDNFETIKAKALGKYKYIDKNLYYHEHPVFKKIAWDEQYRKTESAENYSKDRATFLRLLKEHNYAH